MYGSFLSLSIAVSLTRIIQSESINQNAHFEEELQSFSVHSRASHKKIQEVMSEVTPVCIRTDFTQKNNPLSIAEKIPKKNRLNIVERLSKNVQFLKGICDFTHGKLMVTTRVHRRMIRDQHQGYKLIRRFERMHGKKFGVVKYRIEEGSCNQQGASPSFFKITSY